MINVLSTILFYFSAFIVLAEALNKLERTNPCCPGLTLKRGVEEWLKAAAWGLMALASGGSLLGVFVGFPQPPMVEACLMIGFAVLIVRTRVKEG